MGIAREEDSFAEQMGEQTNARNTQTTVNFNMCFAVSS